MSRTLQRNSGQIVGLCVQVQQMFFIVVVVVVAVGSFKLNVSVHGNTPELSIAFCATGSSCPCRDQTWTNL